MTTTAEKIVRLEKDLEVAQIEINRLKAVAQKIRENQKDCTTDHEPLECWATLNEHGDILWIEREDKDQIAEHTRKVYMRQVTPQMLRNEKDAATLRKLKQLSIQEAVAVVGCRPKHWEEQIDKTMEES